MRRVNKFLIWLFAVMPVVLARPGDACAGGVYKWLDADGQVNFSDRAPLGRDAQTFDTRSSSGSVIRPESTGLRDAEKQLLKSTRRRDAKVILARQHSVNRHMAAESMCRIARERYDRAKRRPGAIKTLQLREYYDEMKARCR